MKRTSSGSEIIDSFLEGGYEADSITTIYGPGGSGKTCLCLIAAKSAAKSRRKIIYIDTEGNFSTERLKQLDENYKETLSKIAFLNPTSFEDQKKVFEELKKAVNDKIGLIVVDTIAMLYRLEMGKDNEKVYEINRELGKQLSLLTEIARKKNIPVLVTNQVYSNMKKEGVRMVGGDLLKYGSKCLIELTKGRNGIRKATLIKHRSIQEGKEIKFSIIDKGIIINS